MGRLKVLRKEKDIVGLYIGDKEIFVSQLKKSPSGDLEVAHLANISTPPSSIQQGIIIDRSSVAEAVKGLFAKSTIESKYVAVCVGGADLIAKIVSLPRMSRNETKEALKAEAAQYMLSGQEPIVDFYPLDKEKKMLIALKKEVVTSIVATIEEAGLNLVAIDIVPLAMLRAINKSNIGLSKDTAMLLIVEDRTTNIIVIKKGLPFFFHSFDSTEISELFKEIEQTLFYWQEQSPEEMISKIIISGDTNRAKHLNVELPDRIEIAQIEQARPKGLEETEFNLSKSLSLGLAMRGADFPFDIDLTPPEKGKKEELRKKIRLAFISIISIFPILLMTSYIFSQIAGSYKQKMASLAQQLEATQDIFTEFEKMNAERNLLIANLEDRKDLVSSIKILPWRDFLVHIKRSIPDDVWLTEIRSKDRDSALVLEGKAYSQDYVYNFLNLLGHSNYFEEPKLASMTDDETKEGSVVNFDIICPLVKE